MKTLNVRLLAILVACVVIGVPALYGINWLQKRRTSGIFLEKAADAEKRAEDAQDNLLSS